jgi:hypothetical protein
VVSAAVEDVQEEVEVLSGMVAMVVVVVVPLPKVEKVM